MPTRYYHHVIIILSNKVGIMLCSTKVVFGTSLGDYGAMPHGQLNKNAFNFIG